MTLSDLAKFSTTRSVATDYTYLVTRLLRGACCVRNLSPMMKPIFKTCCRLLSSYDSSLQTDGPLIRKWLMRAMINRVECIANCEWLTDARLVYDSLIHTSHPAVRLKSHGSVLSLWENAWPWEQSKDKLTWNIPVRYCRFPFICFQVPTRQRHSSHSGPSSVGF